MAPSVRTARAQQKTLRILHWRHFVPAFDRWFNETYVKEWGAKHDTHVIVDNIGFGDINARAAAEVEAKKGHDLTIFITPPTIYDDHVIDHREVYEECEHQHGQILELAKKSTFNARSRKHFGFCTGYSPPLISYRKDLWDSVHATPDTWEQVHTQGRRIRFLHGKPVAFSLAPEQNSDNTMRAIMYSFGSFEQNEDGVPTLKSKPTSDAIRYVMALYRDAMAAEMLRWDATSNNRFMLTGDGSLTLDTVSIPRAGERMRVPFVRDLLLAKPPAGPSDRLAPAFGYLTYVIWNFAENISGARQFLVDYIAHSGQAFRASEFQNMPSMPTAVPDLATITANDPGLAPPDKYEELAQASSWAVNIGYPGNTNAAIGEIFNRGLIPSMFARAATGQATPDEALDEADGEVRRIFGKWRERGKV